MTLARKTPLKRTAMKRKPRRAKPGSSEIEFRGEERAAIERRSGGRCEAGTEVCTGKARVIHHRLLKSAGGRGGRENGLHICTACHVWIHQHSLVSYARGWMLRRSYDGVDSE